jgi:radical SAM superfamily enzyme YgiQ (UPF0313 family)
VGRVPSIERRCVVNGMKRRILFVNPPIINIADAAQTDFVMRRQSIENLPYGILSMCSYLKERFKDTVEIKVIDLNVEIYKAYLDKTPNLKSHVAAICENAVRDFRPDVVGISIMFTISSSYLASIVSSVKKLKADALVVVGGNYSTSSYDEILKNDGVDAVCYGEGEIPVAQLLASADCAGEIRTNPSFVTRERLAAGARPVNQLVEDLNQLPPVDFDFVEYGYYEKPKVRIFQKDASRVESEPVTLVLYTSRGCPFNCCFCACHVMHGKRVRYLSVERVVGDVKLLMRQYGIQCLFINDDNFLLNKARAKQILRELVALKLTVNFPSVLMRNIDDEIAGLLAQLGVTTQLVSIESGSEYVLRELIDKPLRKGEMKDAIENLRRHGISCDTNVIIGFPGETDAHRQETLETVDALGFNWVYYFIVLPVPGTRLYRQCEENGYLVDPDFFSPNFSKCNIRTPDCPPEHVEQQVYMMNLHTNFVHNYNLRVGNYDTCIRQFTNMVQLYPEHAFAYHSLARAYAGKGEHELAEAQRRKFRAIIERDAYWKQWADYFHLA